MAIYDFSKAEKSELKISPFPNQKYEEENFAEPKQGVEETSSSPRGRFFSSLAARLFFLILWIADLLWAGYALVLVCLSLLVIALSWGKWNYFKQLREQAWLSLRRSLVCGVSLFLALFSPSFGIMIACTYFLMYDKSGIEEVVPSSLQTQFKEFFPKDES
jgi:hypothetical protein